MHRNLTVTAVDVGGRSIGANAPCFVIAEAGVNHNGDSGLALELVDAAAAAGADAVKFQTFNAEQLVTADAPKASYQLAVTGSEESQYDMLRRLQLSTADHEGIARHCREKGIMFMSTPFDEESADLLMKLGMYVFKISSGDITNLPFLAHVARLNNPIVLSTGASSLGDVEKAVEAVHRASNRRVVLLHCVSAYPAAPEDANLRAMHTLAAAFNVPVGFSDHTPGIDVALAAVALGACVIEKHLTLDRRLLGPDHRSSLQPAEFRALVKGIRTVESALGDGRKVPVPSESDAAVAARRSLVAACDIIAGTRLTEAHVAVKRPGTGLAPSMLPHVVGRTVRREIAAGVPFTLDMLL